MLEIWLMEVKCKLKKDESFETKVLNLKMEVVKGRMLETED